jgi:hypothetical protein
MPFPPAELALSSPSPASPASIRDAIDGLERASFEDPPVCSRYSRSARFGTGYASCTVRGCGKAVVVAASVCRIHSSSMVARRGPPPTAITVMTSAPATAVPAHARRRLRSARGRYAHNVSGARRRACRRLPTQKQLDSKRNN